MFGNLTDVEAAFLLFFMYVIIRIDSNYAFFVLYMFTSVIKLRFYTLYHALFLCSYLLSTAVIMVVFVLAIRILEYMLGAESLRRYRYFLLL